MLVVYLITLCHIRIYKILNQQEKETAVICADTDIIGLVSIHPACVVGRLVTKIPAVFHTVSQFTAINNLSLYSRLPVCEQCKNYQNWSLF